MRRNILGIVLLCTNLLSSQISASEFRIKSLRIYSSYDQTTFPIIISSDPLHSQLTIDFDIEGSYIPNLNIIFKFCDRNWMPYDNVFLQNFGHNTEFNLVVTRLHPRIKRAQYHYRATFPNNNVTFPFSGKWRFFIVDPHNRNEIFGEGKFFVVNPEVKIKTEIAKGRLQDSNPELSILGRTITLTTSFVLPDSLFPFYVKSVEVIENKKFAYSRIIDRGSFSGDTYYEWNGSNKFSFIVQNVKSGNNYRQADIMSISKYDQVNVNALFDGIETSNLFKKNFRDFNGGAHLMEFNSEYAEYLTVNFRIRPPDNITSPVFLVGSFNNWEVLPNYELYDDNGLLNLSIELKRGIYDYAFVTGDFKDNKIKNIDWNILEGNYWETENEYHVFLYYESQEKGMYDKIIGFTKIKSGEIWKN